MIQRDTETPTYTAQQLAAASGLTSVLVQQYSERGILQAETFAVGRRTYRRYDYTEVVVAAAISVLRRLGIGPGEVAGQMRRIAAEWAITEGGPQGARYAVFQESRSPIYCGAGTTIDEALHSKLPQYSVGAPPAMGEPCAVIAVDLVAIERAVRARLAS